MKTKHAFIAAHASEHAIRFMCRVLGVAHSLFQPRRRAAPKRAERAARPGRLGSEIREIFEQSKRCYGTPRIHAELKARGLRISKRTVAKLMRENGIRPPRGRRRAPHEGQGRFRCRRYPAVSAGVRSGLHLAPRGLHGDGITRSHKTRCTGRAGTTGGWAVNGRRVVSPVAGGGHVRGAVRGAGGMSHHLLHL